MDPETKKFIELYATQEEELALLYHGYSFQFDDAEFWRKIASEESIHQSWILALSQEEDVEIDPQHMNGRALQEMIDYIRNLKEEQKNHDKLKALALAYDIESSLIEKNLFEIYKTDSSNVQHVLNNLKNATKEHINRVKEELEKNK